MSHLHSWYFKSSGAISLLASITAVARLDDFKFKRTNFAARLIFPHHIMCRVPSHNDDFV